MPRHKFDENGPRCPECNELLNKTDLKNFIKNGHRCHWCLNTSHYKNYGRSGAERGDMSDWIKQLWLDDMPLRNRAERFSGSDLRRQ